MIDCIITDVIRVTLATCDYSACNKMCYDYLILVSQECPRIFNNEVYNNLWETLYNICSVNFH
jgi:hypothetical protein